MKTNSQLRRQARLGLKGNWGMMALCYLLVLLATYVLILPVTMGSVIATITSGTQTMTSSLIVNVWQILVAFAMLPASWMLSVMCLRLVRGEYGQQQVRLGEVFEGYRYTNRVVGTYLLQTLVALAAIAIPFAAASFISLLDSRDGSTFYGTFWALMLIIIAIVVFVSLRLSMIFYLIWDTQLGPWKVLKESNRMMKGRCWKMFGLWLSFLGWAILAIFTLGIGFLWLVPYINASMGAFYDDIRAEEAAAAVEREAVEEQPAALDVEPQDQE